MNFIENDENGLLYANFSQNKDCIIFGTTIGFYVYTCNPFKKIISRRIIGGISIIEMLNKSNIMIFTGNVNKGLYPNNKLIIWDDNQGEVIGEIEFKTRILTIKIINDIIVISTLNKIYIYNFNNIELIKSIEINPDCSGKFKINKNLIVYPDLNLGNICVFNYKDSKSTIITAHENSIELFCLSKDNKYLATCSKKGTLIRIFSIATSEKVKELRRGSDQAKIIDLKFNDELNYLLCASDKGTIHIFNALVDSEDNKNGNLYMINSIKNYLPEYFSSEWSYKQFYLPGIITISEFIDNSSKLLTIGSNGCLYSLDFNDTNTEINNVIKFISNDDDPFKDRNSTIK